MARNLSKPEMAEQLRKGYVDALARLELYCKSGLSLQSIKVHYDFGKGETYFAIADKSAVDSNKRDSLK